MRTQRNQWQFNCPILSNGRLRPCIVTIATLDRWSTRHNRIDGDSDLKKSSLFGDCCNFSPLFVLQAEIYQSNWRIARLSASQIKSCVALSSLVVVCLFVPSRIGNISTIWCFRHIFSESPWSQDIKTDITKCLILKYTNTNTQIHKYSIWWSTRKTQYVVYFWKEDCSRVSKMILLCVKRANTQIQIHKYSIWRSARKTQHAVYS